MDTAQALLQATDTALSRAWRDEDRGWRKADLAWRDHAREEERAFRREQEAWRRQDLVQRHVENARALWARHVEKNRWGSGGAEEATCSALGLAWLASRLHSLPPTHPLHAPPPAHRRRDVEERAEQLKSISNLSALVAGFALGALGLAEGARWLGGGEAGRQRELP